MNILTLNLNGLGKGDFKSFWVSDLIKKHNIAMVGLQETKRREISDLMVKRIWGSPDFEFVYRNSVGQGGGLLSVWNKHLFVKESSICRDDCIVLKGVWTENNCHICFINCYANQCPVRRVDLWQFISNMLTDWRGVAIVFGDFNDVRNPMERVGSSTDDKATAAFNEFIRGNNLVDVKIGDRKSVV